MKTVEIQKGILPGKDVEDATIIIADFPEVGGDLFANQTAQALAIADTLWDSLPGTVMDMVFVELRKRFEDIIQ